MREVEEREPWSRCCRHLSPAEATDKSRSQAGFFIKNVFQNPWRERWEGGKEKGREKGPRGVG